jgi:hypothetical protein
LSERHVCVQPLLEGDEWSVPEFTFLSFPQKAARCLQLLLAE